MASFLDKVYVNSPVWLQNLGISLYGFTWRQRRYGGKFQQYVSEFRERESFTAEQWRSYQETQLRTLLVHANEHVPYYRNLFRDLPLTTRDLAKFSLDDLEKLPLLTKAILRDRQDEFIADNLTEKLATYLTSGTTGTPLAIQFTREGDRLAQAAYESRVRNWAGVNFKMSRAMIGGRLVVPKAHARPPFWRFNFVERQLYMSAFHISPDNVPEYAKALNHYQPDYLVGYASSHFFLARMLEELNISMYQPKAVLTSSEKLTSEMRSTIERVYHCEVYDGYSGVEACCQASECEFHRLHISPDMGIVEILGDDDKPVSTGSPGRIVATGLLNYAQPLIRFDTGDVAILSDQGCACGIQMPVIEELVGRLEDIVIGADGRETVRFHGIFVGLPNVKEGQIIQDSLTEFRLRIAVSEAFNEDDKKVIRSRFEQRLGKINLKFEFVEKIERTERGKFRAVISHISRHL